MNGRLDDKLNAIVASRTRRVAGTAHRLQRARSRRSLWFVFVDQNTGERQLTAMDQRNLDPTSTPSHHDEHTLDIFTLNTALEGIRYWCIIYGVLGFRHSCSHQQHKLETHVRLQYRISLAMLHGWLDISVSDQLPYYLRSAFVPLFDTPNITKD